MSTQGISPKVWAPVVLQAVALIVNFAATGAFDRVEWAQLLGVALTAAVGYLAGPGAVGEPSSVGQGSDALLPAEAKKQIPEVK